MSGNPATITDVTPLDAPEKRSYPGIGVWCCLALTALAVFFVWPFVDSNYSFILQIMRYYSGVDEPPGHGFNIGRHVWNHIAEWDRDGKRYTFFIIGTAIGATSFFIMLIQFFRRVSLFRTVGVFCVTVCWIGLWVSYPKILDRSMMGHVDAAMPRFKMTADELMREWATEKGRLPSGEYFLANPDERPNELLLPIPGEGFPARLQLAYQIERLPKDCLRCGLSFSDGHQLEHRPDGSKPATFVDKTGWETKLVRATPLAEENWYLVLYERHVMLGNGGSPLWRLKSPRRRSVAVRGG